MDEQDWVFDEDFVRGAKKQEDSAEVRADRAARVRAGHEQMAQQGMLRGPQPTAKPDRPWTQKTLGIPRWVILGVTLLLVTGMVGLVVAQVL